MALIQSECHIEIWIVNLPFSLFANVGYDDEMVGYYCTITKPLYKQHLIVLFSANYLCPKWFANLVWFASAQYTTRHMLWHASFTISQAINSSCIFRPLGHNVKLTVLHANQNRFLWSITEKRSFSMAVITQGVWSLKLNQTQRLSWPTKSSTNSLSIADLQHPRHKPLFLVLICRHRLPRIYFHSKQWS